MANTGFTELRLVRTGPLDPTAHKTAVHAGKILDRARIFPDLAEAVADLHLVFAGTAKSRKNFEILSWEEALDRILAAPSSARIGLLFGNERTGLTSEELRHSNFRFTIPQAASQPSYNLAGAVLLTLFALFSRSRRASPLRRRRESRSLLRREQERFLRLIIEKLDAGGFLHAANRRHMGERLSDLFGRLALTDEDRRLLLAVFSQAARQPDRPTQENPKNKGATP
jgi:tRNA/rRNA methyltransferase